MSNYHSQPAYPRARARALAGLPLVAVAAAVLAWSSPAFAAPKRRPPQQAPAAQQAHAPVAHQAPRGHGGAQIAHRPPPNRGNQIAHRAPAPQRAPIARRAPGNPHAPRVAQQPPRVSPRNPIAQGNRNAPNRNHAEFRQNPPPIASRNINQTFNRNTRVSRNSTYIYAPQVVSRDWDHGHEHSWNHHWFHWQDGLWVSIDPGYYYDTPVYGDYYTGSSVPASPSPGLVRAVQSALNDQGYDAGYPDGVIGAQTRDALRSYQNDHGLAVTGWIDGSVRSSLGV